LLQTLALELTTPTSPAQTKNLEWKATVANNSTNATRNGGRVRPQWCVSLATRIEWEWNQEWSGSATKWNLSDLAQAM